MSLDSVRPLLAVREGTKRFCGVLALDHVDIEVFAGEVLALLGDNGAGKSTLIKCMSGVHRLDSGSIEIDGKVVQIQGPADARDLGIETVYQDLALFDNLNPSSNFYAGRELSGPRWLPVGMRLLSQKAMVQNTNEVLTRLRVTLPDLDAPVGLMSGGQRQAVAVARATAFSSRLVILDEPTAALGLREAARVLELITRLRNDQKAVVVISHAMDHVIEVADRAIVMRRGRTVGELVPSEESRERIVSLIVGGDG
jgi:ABC-type sugar transport system ATPase subunit